MVKEILIDWLGNSPRIKVLQFLINNKDRSYSVRDIIMGAGVKHRNLVETLKDFLKKDIVFIDKKVGKSNLYKINEFEPLAQSLILANGQKG